MHHGISTTAGNGGTTKTAIDQGGKKRRHHGRVGRMIRVIETGGQNWGTESCSIRSVLRKTIQGGKPFLCTTRWQAAYAKQPEQMRTRISGANYPTD